MTKQQIIERLKLFSASYERMAGIFEDTNDNASGAILAVKADVDSLIDKATAPDKKVFMFFESQEGGMDYTIFSNPKALDFLVFWGEDKDDTDLVTWLKTANIGEVFYHRLGVCVRLDPAEGDE